MDRALKVGQAISYTDELGQKHDALVTIVWSSIGCNLVFVSSDGAKDDSYGRQIERRSSVTHKSGQPAPGNYWQWSDEV